MRRQYWPVIVLALVAIATMPAWSPSAEPAKKAADVLLDIPARHQAPGHPESGWCGETAIQEALLYHGGYFPQRAINAAGRPSHPDLYASEVPVALRALGAKIEPWPAGQRELDLDRFLAWIRRELGQGVPVLVGVKINPTQQPEWILDHFVLVVGASGDSLMMNTTWGTRSSLAESQLRSMAKGWGFANRYHAYYGIAVLGLGDASDHPVRLAAGRESEGEMTLTVKCQRLAPGETYVVSRSPSLAEKTGKQIAVFRAKESTQTFTDAIRGDRPAIYRCGRSSGR